jgi:phospholipid/cholesterol/gamma-HCH transport system substrate-binding protein
MTARVRLLIAGLTVLGVIGVALLARGADSGYRVAAIFDTAGGIGSGQLVKLAGVEIGTVERVTLAPGPKARVVMHVNPGTAPFHADATCTILPEGLITESFVQCDPGSKRSGPLPPGAEGIPTVALERTSVPASLQSLLQIFSLPVNDRLRALIDELGVATAGRGADLNAILRRSNPALAQAQKALSVINTQRGELTTAISETDRVLATLTADETDVRAFVDEAATVAETTADHRDPLGESVRRLPALLEAVQPGLRSLDRAMEQGTPVLDSLHAAAPELTTTTRVLPTFFAEATPALRSVGEATSVGREAIGAALPVISSLRRASQRAIPFATNLHQLLFSTRNAGGFEGVLRLMTSLATTLAGYDGVSHMISVYLKVFPQCFAQTGAAGCDGRYLAPGGGTVPPDDPTCGAHDGATWDPPTNCLSLVGVRSTKPKRSGRPRQERKPHARSPARPSIPDAPKPAPSAPPAGNDGLLGNLPLERPRLPHVPIKPVDDTLQAVLDLLLGP